MLLHHNTALTASEKCIEQMIHWQTSTVDIIVQ